MNAYASECDEPIVRRRRPQPQSSSSGGLLVVLGGIASAGVMVLILGGLLLVAALPSKHGERIKLNNGSELYYTSTVTADEAHRFANFLNDDDLGLVKNGTRATFQLNKTGDCYEVRLVVKPGAENDPDIGTSAKVWGVVVSRKVFGGAPVEIHLCNERLNTVKVFEMSR